MTIPFDEVAFRNGAVAINSEGDEITFKCEVDGTFFYSGGVGFTKCSVEFAQRRWSMKSTTSEYDWLPVKGDGTIPAGIAGAKAGEWEAKFKCGDTTKHLADVCAMSRNTWLHGLEHHIDIVAVRLVKKEEKSLPEADTGIDKDGMQVISEKAVKELQDMLLPKRKEATKQSITTDPKISRDRAALSRFQSSPRGKEFRAQLGHVDAPPPAIGQDGIEGAIFAALCESMRREGR